MHNFTIFEETESQHKFNFDFDSNWSLANDVELLKYLEKYSENIIRKASVIINQLNELEENLTSTSLYLKNIGNELNAISENKFTENFVEDYDETKDGSNENIGNLNDNLDRKFNESLSNCLNYLENNKNYFSPPAECTKCLNNLKFGVTPDNSVHNLVDSALEKKDSMSNP
ncbi:hypothetical protein O3M35_005731 [Rhynocoris fuscipes]|uniref:Uncharacterized protein n=1 Tax=Rhynocoris fuscipes TaxID=488301 RepID=A0AAW1DJ87_9HEMI